MVCFFSGLKRTILETEATILFLFHSWLIIEQFGKFEERTSKHFLIIIMITMMMMMMIIIIIVIIMLIIIGMIC